jgi:2-dehydro-3-deoxyphosphogluconate aldolase/(4S)-4-hydroxy-2-oxoglutarate aldolase
VTKTEVRDRIEETGLIPAIRMSATDDARFIVETLCETGLPIVEITLTTPQALELISECVRRFPEAIIGAGTVLDAESAQRCVGAGAMFLTSTGLDVSVVGVAVEHQVLSIPGALTPTEIISAWKAGADLVKVFPSSSLGGEHYIRAMKTAMPPGSPDRRRRHPPTYDSELHSRGRESSRRGQRSAAGRGRAQAQRRVDPRIGPSIHRPGEACAHSGWR